ncbi:hypothetical protein [Halorubrum sp. F4]|uniref:hypothetical protein n=1 Tax=Halorubrum sp. F4 TaxID=2989715 RepID=UPI0024809E71|nr:hypothetical protein [Halorubrum sp. F4]
MSTNTLPSRAKPEALYETCRLLGDEAVERSELYDQTDFDRRQIAAACDYGELLGFLEYVDESQQSPQVKLGDLGHALRYADSMEESGVQNAFKRAIEMYAPYRNGFLSIVQEEKFEESDGERWITIDDLSDAVSTYFAHPVQNREINLLLKTAEAAGLGTRTVGRRGYPTRLVINSKFDTFASSLVDSYELPEPTEVIEEPGEHDSDSEEPTAEPTEEPEQDGDDEHTDEPVTESPENETASLLAKLRSENVTLEVAVDISEKTDQEILSIIDEIEHIAD